MINNLLFSILLLMFSKSRNTLTTLIIFFVIMHFIEVVYVGSLFSKIYSTKSDQFGSIDIIGNCLFIFVSVFFFVNYKYVDRMPVKYKIFQFKSYDLVPFILISSFSIWVLRNAVIINRLDYHLISQNSTPVDEYVIILFSLVLIYSKCRVAVLIPFILMGLIYAYTGQRLKFLILMFTVYLLLKDSYRLVVPFKILIIITVFIAIGIDIMRGEGSSLVREDVHMSHFGELAVTSMSLLIYADDFNFYDNVKVTIGMILGNLIPSSLLPIGYDLKRMLSSVINVPGGGWLPIWAYSVSGYSGVFLISLFTSYIAKLLNRSLQYNYLNYNINNLTNICYISFTTSVVIWFMYSPYVLLKFLIYSIIFHTIWSVSVRLSLDKVRLLDR
jgi:hypothetical protein